MKWTVLTDNRTQNPLLQTEHGLSILLETEKHRLLLDTGASDVFIRNSEQLGIDLSTVDYVFISHGHSDHAGGGAPRFPRYSAWLGSNLARKNKPATTATAISMNNICSIFTYNSRGRSRSVRSLAKASASP